MLIAVPMIIRSIAAPAIVQARPMPKPLRHLDRSALRRHQAAIDGQPSTKKRPSPVHPRFHVGNGESQRTADLAIRPALDLAEQQGGSMAGRQLIDRCRQGRP